MKRPDDDALLAATAAGDRSAFETFVKRHQAPAFRYLRGLAPDVADAEDALQETFLGVWRSASTYRGGPSARGWVLTIARNALRRAYRRHAGEPERFEPLDELGVRAGWGRPDDVLDKLANRDLIARALERVPPEQREVLLLRDIEGMSGNEVAHVLGLSVPAMKSRLHRARLELVAGLRELADA